MVPLVPSEMLHIPSPTVPVPTAAAALSPAPATTFTEALWQPQEGRFLLLRKIRKFLQADFL